MFGSPPRARGRRHARRRGDGQDAVHPRVRGDDAWAIRLAERAGRFTPACAGTTAERSVAGDAAERFTPACAGTTVICSETQGTSFGSPPRARGRRAHEPVRTPRLGGSPPRARGRRRAGEPTRARGPVHPRVRGDDVELRAVRGEVRRFTPACAGTTPERENQHHPIARFTPACAGTTKAFPKTSRSSSGSPPRARGRPFQMFSIRSAMAVHPRVRGDDDCRRALRCRAHGSPPRARGRLRIASLIASNSAVHPRVRGDDGPALAIELGDFRFTPACAGTTSQPSAPGVR